MFETTDPELAHDFLTRAYTENHMSVNAVSGAMRLSHARQDAGLFYQDVYVNSMDVTFTSQPLRSLLVARVVAGRFERTVAGVSERFGPGDIYLVSGPHQPFSCASDGVHLSLIGISLDAVADVAGDPSLTVPGQLRVTSYRPASPAAARTWNHALGFVSDGLLANEDARSAPLLTASTARWLAATALATFASDAGGDPGPEETRDAHPRTLRRAMAYIDDHADQDISVADIAAAAFVTVRAVQQAFRRHLDVTPLEHLRQVRLERAHADLLAADPARESVTAVAYRWSFPSPGRFAAAYRQAYGVLPSATLRRG